MAEHRIKVIPDAEVPEGSAMYEVAIEVTRVSHAWVTVVGRNAEDARDRVDDAIRMGVAERDGWADLAEGMDWYKVRVSPLLRARRPFTERAWDYIARRFYRVV